MRLLAGLLLSTSLLSSCDVAQCAGICVAVVELTLVDGQNAPVNAARGVITVGGQTEAFDCAQGSDGTTHDGGPLTLVRCAGNKLSFRNGASPSQLDLTVTGPGGNNLLFSGTVELTYSETGESICGSRCRVASKTVTLQ